MNFTDIFIRRPVFSIALSLMLLLVGALAYSKLPILLLPKVGASMVKVSVNYPGADSELVEGFVTTRIETALSGVEGVDYISSNSYQGGSEIEVLFKLGYDVNVGAADVRARVAAIRDKLPQGIKEPIISKRDPNMMHTLMFLGFTSITLPREQMTDYVNRIIEPQLQNIPGVASIGMIGDVSYVMKILLNPFLMAAHQVTASEVQRALASQSLQAPAGQIETATQAVNVKTLSEVATNEQFNNLIIKESAAHLIRLQDIGRAEFGPAKSYSSAVLNGEPTVVAEVFAAMGSDWFGISTMIHKILPLIKQNLPQGMDLKMFWEDTQFIDWSVKNVRKAIIEATIWVVLVMFLFLGSWRTVLVPLVTIPLSLIGGCAMMLFLGYSLNVVTFYALILAVGLVVDDAIVVAENIHRHMVAGKSRFDAAILGAREIQFAIISMTIALAAVYAPIGLISGFVGTLFKEFAFTLAGIVIVSGFIALTLSPMMCSALLAVHNAPGSFAARIDTFFAKFMDYYRRLLSQTLQHRRQVLLVIVGTLLLCGALYKIVPHELAPSEDFRRIFISVNGPTTANLAYTEKYTAMIGNILKTIPECEYYFVRNGGGGVNNAFVLAVLKSWEERKRSVAEIIQELAPQFAAIPGVRISASAGASLPDTGSDEPISLIIQTTGDYAELYQVVQKVMEAAKANPHFKDVRSNLYLDQMQVRINVNRNKAGILGISMFDIGNAINFAIGRPTSGYFNIAGRNYEVVPQLEQNFFNHPGVLQNLYLNTKSGELVPLANLITMHEVLQPSGLSHYQKLRAAEVRANLTSGYSQGEGLKYIQEEAKKILPQHMQLTYGGQSRQYFEAGHQMLFTFLFALMFIFLILAVQFESFRSPFIVLFTVPLSLFGALVALFFTGNTINVWSQIGLVTLVGLISKHGILMVEFANQLHAAGKSIHDAIVESAVVRLRPILMTTAAIVVGVLPLALAHGAFAASQHQIGWTVIGGMSIGTLFTLFIVPTIYTYLAPRHCKRPHLAAAPE
jgi:multidrug efflux pump